MANITIVFGALLTVLGIGSYLASDAKSWTALIPSILGVLMILLGALSRKAEFRKHGMHAAAALAVLGVVGSVIGLIAGTRREPAGFKPASGVPQLITVVLLAVFVAMCVRSFIAARRQREAGGTAS